MNSWIVNGIKDLVGILLFVIFVTLFLFNTQVLDYFDIVVSDTWLNVNVLFLSILLEAVPFVLLGVFVSALIQSFVSEELLQKVLPKHAYLGLVPAALLGAVFPVCECAIIPVVRRLIKKGMPLQFGVVLLMAAPILNPIVAASTYYAFQNDLTILYLRMGLGFVLSIVIGFVMYQLFKNTNQLRWTKEELIGRTSYTTTMKRSKWKQTLYHASDEFFDMGKYLIVGAFLASVVNGFLDRNVLASLTSSEGGSTAIMMGFAFILSLCSEADAFVASSFSNQFSSTSLLAFLVYGPMLDLKNLFMYLAYFKTKFVLALVITISIVTFCSIMLVDKFLL
ncbi:permease [Alkalihalobacillus sp. CinArs1]|uniref:permease n=1 Tax=Alkalihalobacillus sp. CinArs1 TaxID=2995314 RepID=UPI0022DE3946|nr:permease [Alkalihalobacillus sp. CinArs1]